jgi:hypothetical protein
MALPGGERANPEVTDADLYFAANQPGRRCVIDSMRLNKPDEMLVGLGG